MNWSVREVWRAALAGFATAGMLSIAPAQAASERWNYPDDGYGDCEDYVLLKRKMLMQAGWPRQALLITVVRDKQGDGHAVLTVKTDKGEFILDNQTEEVLLWSETEYRFVKRQSQTDPNVWIALGDSRPAAATATSR